jgi:hypothetical protein
MHIFQRCQTVLTTASLLVLLCAPAWAQSPTAAQATTQPSSSCRPTAGSVSATPAKAASNADPGKTTGNLENQDTSESPAVLQSLPLPIAPNHGASTNSCLSITQPCWPGAPNCCGSLRCRLPAGQSTYRCLP